MPVSTLILSWPVAPAERPNVLDAVAVVKALGALRPGIAEPFTTVEAKTIAAAMRGGLAVEFDVIPTPARLIGRAVHGRLQVLDGPADVRAEAIWIGAGIARLERLANASVG